MTISSPVELELNLLEYEENLRTPADYLRFWDHLSAGLLGNRLIAGRTHILESPNKGKIGLTIISVPQDFSVVMQDTRFAVHSVLEQPDLRYKCSVCRTYGPFRCGERSCNKRLCDQHAIILDGNMRAYCSEHVPRCKGSGAKATFWCDGRGCRGRVAWSDAYRVRHPNDADHWYCPDCYALEFPPCSIQMCQDTGTTRCEYIYENTGESCNRSLCNKHVRRWQIYGPHKLGVALCSEHANIKQQSESSILHQMAAVTVKRNYNRRRYREYLPSLMSIRHIFINSKNEVYDPVHIDNRLERLAQQLRTSNERLNQDMGKLIQQSKSRREKDIERFGGQQQQGQTIFQMLQEKLRLQGEDVLVANLRFSDYRPRHKLLFIYLDPQYRGRLIGRRGTNIKQLQQELDVRIKFEDN